MSTEGKVPYAPHEHQKRVHRSTADNRVVVAGRQSGKTVAAVNEASVWAMSAPRRWPDERFPQIWWTTATYGTKGKAWRDFGVAIPREIIARSHESQAWFELKNGSRISFKSADGKDSLVSERLHGLVADEFCQYRSEVWHQLLAPMLATTGGPVIFSGTPRGHNWGYEIFQNQQRGVPGWESFHWSVYDSPYVEKLWIAQRRLETPERLWQQEYMAEFLTDGGEVFRNIDTAIRPAASPDGFNVIGLDLARTHDWTALMAFNSAGQWIAYRRVGHLDWSVQRIAVIEMYRRLQGHEGEGRPVKVVLDATGIQLGAEAVVYDLQREGLNVDPVTISGEIKRALVEGLMLRFDLGSISIPMETAEEFRTFGVEQLPSGYDRYSAPQGKNDDYVMAAALAMWGLRHFNAQPLPEKPKSIVEQELARLGFDPDHGQKEPGSGWWG